MIMPPDMPAETFLDYIRHTENRNLIRVMDEGIAEANRKVLEKSFENEELAGMGTTMVVADSQRTDSSMWPM